MIVNMLRERLVEALGVPDHHLNRLILRAPHTYKIYTIPKKNKGRRTIAQPAKETKYIQHWLMSNIFNALPLHDCATAYRKNASIKHNAELHASNAYLSKFDFKDFFTSIKDVHLACHLSKYLGGDLSEDEINDIVRLSCIKMPGKDYMCLSIGAPSSPMLSNTIMFQFDTKISDWCASHGVSYTRYADDLAFSTNENGVLTTGIEAVIRGVARDLDCLALRLNNRKTAHLSKKHQRRITGLIINNDGNVSLGRSRKRKISSMVHKYDVKALSGDQVYYLQGLLGFAKYVEPQFIERLNRKYGSDVISRILSLRK